jgi:hypothetical protein
LSLDSCFCYSCILDQYDAYSNTKSVISLRTNLCFPSQLLQTWSVWLSLLSLASSLHLS